MYFVFYSINHLWPTVLHSSAYPPIRLVWSINSSEIQYKSHYPCLFIYIYSFDSKVMSFIMFPGTAEEHAPPPHLWAVGLPNRARLQNFSQKWILESITEVQVFLYFPFPDGGMPQTPKMTRAFGTGTSPRPSAPLELWITLRGPNCIFVRTNQL